jgi:hypothetical protein
MARHHHDIGIAAHLKPTAKSLIKEAFHLYGVAEEALTETGELFEDLASEARAEMKKAQRSRRDHRHKGKS